MIDSELRPRDESLALAVLTPAARVEALLSNPPPEISIEAAGWLRTLIHAAVEAHLATLKVTPRS